MPYNNNNNKQTINIYYDLSSSIPNKRNTQQVLDETKAMVSAIKIIKLSNKGIIHPKIVIIINKSLI